MTQTILPPTVDPTDPLEDRQPTPARRGLLARITPLEIGVGALLALVMLALVVVEPNILEAPFENSRTLLFTFGGTALAAVVFGVMLLARVPAPIRIAVLVVPFALVNWWLLSPYFIDDVVDEEFSTSIAAQLAAADSAGATSATGAGVAVPVPTTAPIPLPDVDVDGTATADAGAAPIAPGAETEPGAPSDTAANDAGTAEPEAAEPEAAAGTDAGAEPEAAAPDPAPAASSDGGTDAAVDADTPAAPPARAAEAPAPVETVEAVEAPTEPVLLGAGQFVGLAGHRGTGVAGIFQNPDGSLTLRFENFDIENGPDLDVYLVPGAGQVSLPAGSINLGPLKGNIGDQNYTLPAGTVLAPGSYTVLVWCEAFGVEFVGATITV
ncbi:MAG: DM13 domain-containing protein [Actinomycetota bacterium]